MLRSLSTSHFANRCLLQRFLFRSLPTYHFANQSLFLPCCFDLSRQEAHLTNRRFLLHFLLLLASHIAHQGLQLHFCCYCRPATSLTAAICFTLCSGCCRQTALLSPACYEYGMSVPVAVRKPICQRCTFFKNRYRKRLVKYVLHKRLCEPRPTGNIAMNIGRFTAGAACEIAFSTTAQVHGIGPLKKL